MSIKLKIGDRVRVYDGVHENNGILIQIYNSYYRGRDLYIVWLDKASVYQCGNDRCICSSKVFHAMDGFNRKQIRKLISKQKSKIPPEESKPKELNREYLLSNLQEHLEFWRMNASEFVINKSISIEANEAARAKGKNKATEYEIIIDAINSGKYDKIGD